MAEVVPTEGLPAEGMWGEQRPAEQLPEGMSGEQMPAEQLPEGMSGEQMPAEQLPEGMSGAQRSAEQLPERMSGEQMPAEQLFAEAMPACCPPLADLLPGVSGTTRGSPRR
jgi:hypothetical protein